MRRHLAIGLECITNKFRMQSFRQILLPSKFLSRKNLAYSQLNLKVSELVLMARGLGFFVVGFLWFGFCFFFMVSFRANSVFLEGEKLHFF